MSNIYVAKEVILDRILDNICEKEDNFIYLFELKEELEKDFYFNAAQEHIYNATHKKDLTLENIFWENDVLRKEEIETRAKILQEKCLQHT
jgi:hypothetical protein